MHCIVVNTYRVHRAHGGCDAAVGRGRQLVREGEKRRQREYRAGRFMKQIVETAVEARGAIGGGRGVVALAPGAELHRKKKSAKAAYIGYELRRHPRPQCRTVEGHEKHTLVS